MDQGAACVPSGNRYPLMYVTLASVVASIGGILFGYDIGITSGALLLLRKQFSLSCLEQELVVSAVLVGAFFASFFGGIFVDHCGRRSGILASCALFAAGALVLGFAHNLAMLVGGRLIVGVAVSVSVTAECTYISEIAPPNRRGMLVSLNEVGITVGFLLAYVVNYAFISFPNGWQYMFGAAVVPAVLQAIGTLLMPPSHHYLLLKGKEEEARKILKKLRNNCDIEDEVKTVTEAIKEQKSRKYADLFSNVSNMRGRMGLGMALVFLQQFSGNANVLYYAPTVFQHFGFHSNTVSTLVTVGLGIVKVLSTGVAVLVVDRVGRRLLLLAGCLLMAASLVALGAGGVAVGASPVSSGCGDPPPLNATPPLNYTQREEAVPGIASKLVSVVALMVFVCAYGISYGPVTWLLLSEIFPSSLRGRAISVATCVNWGSNVIVSMTFLQLLESMGVGETFLLYGFISVGAAVFVFFFVPETKNKSLEEITKNLDKGFLQRNVKDCLYFIRKNNEEHRAA